MPAEPPPSVITSEPMSAAPPAAATHPRLETALGLLLGGLLPTAVLAFFVGLILFVAECLGSVPLTLQIAESHPTPFVPPFTD